MTDLISRADIPYHKQLEPMGNGQYTEVEVAYKDDIESLPSAEQVTGKLKNPCNPLLTDDSGECKEQKSKLDLISRADAIEAVGKYKEEHGYTYYDCACDIENDLKQLPSASAEAVQGEWIPCSERLPEDLQKAITCNKHGKMMIGTYTEWGWMFPCYFEKPIAWMPLPKPYREDGEA